MEKDNLTFVSGYWKVKNKYTHEKYVEWFRNSLNINQRYIFFCEEKDNEFIKSFRNGYETIFINYTLAETHSNIFYNNNWVDSYHCPSLELGKIWHEKIHLLKLAKDYDTNLGSSTIFYVWSDAGASVYREISPPPVRFNYYGFEREKIYYSSCNDHPIAGTSYMVHKNIIDAIHTLYYKELDERKTNNEYISDQHILTILLHKYPAYFIHFARGYGEVLNAILFNVLKANENGKCYREKIL
jgi:hypothetical protein